MSSSSSAGWFLKVDFHFLLSLHSACTVLSRCWERVGLGAVASEFLQGPAGTEFLSWACLGVLSRKAFWKVALCVQYG